MSEQSFRWRVINSAAANSIVADIISIRDGIFVPSLDIVSGGRARGHFRSTVEVLFISGAFAAGK